MARLETGLLCIFLAGWHTTVAPHSTIHPPTRLSHNSSHPQEACRLCFASASRPRNLTVAIGQSAYLALPARGRLVPGHCCIVPAEHVASTRQVDEQVRRAWLGWAT